MSVLTGFLGSGKTTVLNRLVRESRMRRTLVLVNEFGEVGIDHHLIAHSEESTTVELSSGCLCCNIRGDLVTTLSEAVWRFARGNQRWFDQVIIETTGLADPAPILHTLMQEAQLSRHYCLDTVVTTVDAANGVRTLARHEEALKQVAVADRIVVTKSDLADRRSLDELETRLAALNPGAPRYRANHGEVASHHLLQAGFYSAATKGTRVNAWLREEAYRQAHDHHDHATHDVNRHGERIRASCLTMDEPIGRDALLFWLGALITFKGENILRVKGLVSLADRPVPVAIHAVQHSLHPPLELDRWPDSDRRSRMVFITRDMDDTILRGTLDVVMNHLNTRR